MNPAIAALVPRTLDYFVLRERVEEFLVEEADLLDRRQFREWLDLVAEDIVYYMPMRRNVKYGQHERLENTREGLDINWFDEDKWTLTKRVEQIMTGVHWAEEPLSRVCRMVSNVQLLSVSPSVAAPSELTVRSRFLLYQNRIEYETSLFVGKRTDTLRLNEQGFKIARREIILDQSVLLAKNLTVIF